MLEKRFKNYVHNIYENELYYNLYGPYDTLEECNFISALSFKYPSIMVHIKDSVTVINVLIDVAYSE